MHEYSKRAMNRAIFIAGNRRSGTTIIGKIVHSFKSVEYSFEPSFLFSLLPLIDSLTSAAFKTMFESYCFEDLLIRHLAGRSLNFNSHDDSFIYLSKDKQEIASRLSKSWTKKELLNIVDKARLCIKMPNISGPLKKLSEYYPKMTIIITSRNANSVIESTLKKKWFQDENLINYGMIWPRQNETGLAVPMWVEEEMIESWLNWSELERAAYSYVRTTHELMQLKNSILVSYERMIQNPKVVIRELAEKLHLNYGSQTESLIKTLKIQSSLTEDWVSKLPSELRQKVLECDIL